MPPPFDDGALQLLLTLLPVFTAAKLVTAPGNVNGVAETAAAGEEPGQRDGDPHGDEIGPRPRHARL